LINLNARLYDPKLAQFLGLDPLVQEPGMGQNFNRYSYCLNNPLLYSDPSGNSWISDAFHWVKKTIWDTPWRWLNGSDEGHPGVYSGGFSQKLDKWGAPSFGAGYNSSQGGFYYMGNNPRVYPAMEAALQKQYAGVTAQTQAMIAGERQQRQETTGVSDIDRYLFNYLNGMIKFAAIEGAPVRLTSEETPWCSYFAGAINLSPSMYEEYQKYGLSSQNSNRFLIMHEYGHYLQEELGGSLWFNFNVVPSSGIRYNEMQHGSITENEYLNSWTETDANTMSYYYFHYPASWPFKRFPINHNYLSEEAKSLLYYHKIK
jgi:hypothetical protein